ncbi:MAG: molecular chaperone [Thiotrichales bacterium]
MSAVQETGLLARFAEAVAEDLHCLAALHDRELDPDLLGRLLGRGFPDDLALCLERERTVAASALLRGALDELATDADGTAFEALAVDYAAIYLNHSLRAAPMESVWLDEEQLAMQTPMFEVREWMARHGVAVENWRVRPDDHLVPELEFLAHLLESTVLQNALPEAADFMDRHLLRWVDDFTRRVAARCATPFYAGLNALTAGYLDELRDLIAEVTGEPRPSREEVARRIEAEQRRNQSSAKTVPLRYVPGMAPSW